MLQEFLREQRMLMITRNKKPNISRRRKKYKEIREESKEGKVEEGIGENEIQRRLIYIKSNKR